MIRATFIILWLLCCNISSISANENNKVITFAVGHDHRKMLTDNYPIYRASWQFLSQSLEQVGYDVEAIILPWARANYYTQTGKADGLFLAANLPGREQWAVLSSPIGLGSFGGFYHKDRKQHEKVIASVRLGVHDKIMSAYHADEYLEVATAQQGLKLLFNKKIDRFVMSESYGNYLLKTELVKFNSEIIFDHHLTEKRSVHIAFAKDITKSLKALQVVNEAIALGIEEGLYLKAMTQNKVPKSMLLSGVVKE
jgi:polar amino acid transport system substrate-binding protein